MLISALFTLLAQDRCRPIECHTFQIAAKVERHRRIATADPAVVDAQISDAWPSRAPRGKCRRVGQGGLELVGLKTPQANQAADTGIKELFAACRDALGVGDQRSHLGRHCLCLAGRNGFVQCAEFGRLPGMIGAMQAIKLAQHGSGSGACFGFVGTGDQHLDAGTENEGFLLVQRDFGAGGQREEGWQ